MNIYLQKNNIHMSHNESCASHVSESSISASPSFKISRFISSVQSSLFQDIAKKINLIFGTLIFNNGLHFRTCKSRNMADIMLNSNNISREYKIHSRDIIRGTILDACYDTMREIYKMNILNKAEVFSLTGSGDETTVKKKPFINAIMHGIHNPVAVCDIFD